MSKFLTLFPLLSLTLLLRTVIPFAVVVDCCCLILNIFSDTYYFFIFFFLCSQMQTHIKFYSCRQRKFSKDARQSVRQTAVCNKNRMYLLFLRIFSISLHFLVLDLSFCKYEMIKWIWKQNFLPQKKKKKGKYCWRRSWK